MINLFSPFHSSLPYPSNVECQARKWQVSTFKSLVWLNQGLNAQGSDSPISQNRRRALYSFSHPIWLSHYPDAELTSPSHSLLIPSIRLGSDKYQFDKSPLWLDREPISRSPAHETGALPIRRPRPVPYLLLGCACSYTIPPPRRHLRVSNIPHRTQQGDRQPTLITDNNSPFPRSINMERKFGLSVNSVSEY